MRRNDRSMISKNHAKEDFLNLNLNIESSAEDWDFAIDIFCERFDERYWNPIKMLLEDSYNNGFAIMALNCLLIDAFYQFDQGSVDTTRNSRKYTFFLKEYMKEIFDIDDKAEMFYKDIRCGILHSAQTKGHSRLTCDNSDTIEYVDGGTGIQVNVESFYMRLKVYYDNYVKQIREGNEEKRINFIKRMNYVCD